MALTEKRIAALEAKGFKRWTKGEYDRLYINASELGLHCDYYKTGNISNAVFQGTSISNSEGRRMKTAKTYIDVKTGEVHSDNYTLEKAVKAIIEELDAEETTETKTALEEAKEILEGKITDENRELAEEVNRIRNEGKEPETFSWAALLAGATKKAEAAETVTEQETDDSKDMLIVAVQDWEADQQYDDLIVDYNDIGQTDDGEWYVPARDSDHSYMLIQDSDGNIRMV